ncbi:hypothetical protein BKA66DRAFT_514129 [Pyrenochaeta sp. MPI-SDFR-AT-0127]|nr:hypothetical protein BKA66DRAFT_514129 [Pyrenochaeta sp. MPI-SDFR-AT-0127]
MEAPMGFSPFVFEKELNIEFRKVLPDMDTATSLSDHDQRVADLDKDHDMSPPPGDDINIPAKLSPLTPSVSEPTSPIPSIPSTPSVSNSPTSAASTDGTNTCSPAFTSISTSTSSPSSSMSQTPPSSASQTIPSSLSTYPCRLCDVVFRTKGKLTKHWYLSHEKRFSCLEPGCNAAFHLKTDLARHTTSKHVDQEGKVRIGCVVRGCRKIFSRKDNMMRHVRKEHEAGGINKVGR